MLTQKQINERWTVRCDNYNRYVEKEFATDRPEKWLHIIRNHLRVYGKWLEDFKTLHPSRFVITCISNTKFQWRD